MIEIIAIIAGLLGISGLEILKSAKKHLKNLQKSQTEKKKMRRIELFQRILEDGLHTEVLEKLYQKESLKEQNLSSLAVEIEGKRVLPGIVGKPDWLTTEVDLRSNQNYELVEATNNIENLPKQICGKSLAEIEFYGLKIWDQPIYRLINADIGKSHLSVKFSLGKQDSFLMYRLGLGSLWGELMQGLVDTENNVDALVQYREKYLPRRCTLLPDVGTVARYKKRMCVGGIHATVAIQRKDEEDFVIPVQQRSSIVGSGQGLITAIPEAYHQPMIFADTELPFKQTFYREFYEELLGGEEVGKKSCHLCSDWYIKSSKALQWLQQPDANYKLIMTGFGFNLMSGNYEVALLCIIKDTTFWNNYRHLLVTNWETTEHMLPLLSTKDDDALTRMLSRNDWTGSGLFSVARALTYLKMTEPKHVNIPKISVSAE